MPPNSILGTSDWVLRLLGRRALRPHRAGSQYWQFIPTGRVRPLAADQCSRKDLRIAVIQAGAVKRY